MGEVLMHPMGGGIGSDDVTAAKAHVLAGHSTVTTDSDDEVVEGTMPDNGTNKNAVSVGGGSGSLWAYMPYGYYGNYNNSGKAWIGITDDQAKTLANNAGVGYNQGVTDADNRANSSSTNYKSGYNAGYANGKANARLVLISQTYFGNYETKTINISSGILIWAVDGKKYDCFMKNGNSVRHLIDAYAMNQGDNGNPISFKSATDTAVTFNGRYGTISAYQIQ